MAYKDPNYHKKYYHANKEKWKKYNGRRKKYGKKYYQLNKKGILERQRKHREKNKEHRKEYNKNYYRENKEEIDRKTKKYHQKNKEKIREKRKEYYEENKERILKQHRKYMKEYNKTHKKQFNKYFKNRMKNPKWRLSNNISHAIRKALRGNKNGRHWETILGYKLHDLMKRLEKTLPKGMTWQDFLDGKLQIDHIIPVYAFNFDSYNDLDFHRCFALENLQLLEATENMKKNKKIKKSFQPCLKI